MRAIGDLRNKLRRQMEQERHQEWLSKNAPESDPAKPPACPCGLTIYQATIYAVPVPRRQATRYVCAHCHAEENPVCNLYSMTKGPAAIRELARAMRDTTGNLEPLLAIFPDQLAPVVRTGPDGKRELLKMRWGFPPPTGTGTAVTNVRNSKSGWWLPWLKKPEQRCLVPVTSFSEYDHRTKPPTCTWFAQDETRPLMFFAGIWRPWKGARGTKANPVEGEHLLYSFLTTEPNAVVGPVHPKAMPVLLLDEAARDTWLTGDLGAALALQAPAPDGALRVVATGAKQDG